jgi:hypothetical protein
MHDWLARPAVARCTAAPSHRTPSPHTYHAPPQPVSQRASRAQREAHAAQATAYSPHSRRHRAAHAGSLLTVCTAVSPHRRPSEPQCKSDNVNIGVGVSHVPNEMKLLAARRSPRPSLVGSACPRQPRTDRAGLASRAGRCTPPSRAEWSRLYRATAK